MIKIVYCYPVYTYVGPPADPNIMTGIINSVSIQILWNSIDDSACGAVTYHVELRVTANEELIKQDATNNLAYKFTGLSPDTHYTAYVYGSSQAGNSITAMIRLKTASDIGKVFLSFHIQRCNC